MGNLIAELLKNGEVRGRKNGQPDIAVMKVLSDPLEQHLPHGCKCFALTPKGRTQKLDELVESVAANGEVLVFAIGVSEGDAVTEPGFGERYVGNHVAVCPWNIRAASVCQMVCHECETFWDIYTTEQTSDVVEPLPGS